jgi:hypothetical protein
MICKKPSLAWQGVDTRDENNFAAVSVRGPVETNGASRASSQPAARTPRLISLLVYQHAASLAEMPSALESFFAGDVLGFGFGEAAALEGAPSLPRWAALW